MAGIYGERIRPLERRRKGKTIAASTPDRIESWTENGVAMRAEIWEDLSLPGVIPSPNKAKTFRVYAIYDPAYTTPGLLATPLQLKAATVKALYQDRWPLEQIPLAAKQKVGMLPAKADPEKQKEFLEQEIQPRLEEAQAGQRVVLFVDAAFFVLAPLLGFLWSLVRVFVQAPSGRQRFNVLGALNAMTHELITITNETYINAESVCALLEKIAHLYVGLPISIFLDNARYPKMRFGQRKSKKSED